MRFCIAVVDLIFVCFIVFIKFLFLQGGNDLALTKKCCHNTVVYTYSLTRLDHVCASLDVGVFCI